MKFFLDTANLDQIREANDLGVLDGVTTNPSGKPFDKDPNGSTARKADPPRCFISDPELQHFRSTA